MSESGQELVDRFTSTLGSEVQKLLGELPAREQRDLGVELNRIATILDEANAPAARSPRPAPTLESALESF